MNETIELIKKARVNTSEFFYYGVLYSYRSYLKSVQFRDKRIPILTEEQFNKVKDALVDERVQL